MWQWYRVSHHAWGEVCYIEDATGASLILSAICLRHHASGSRQPIVNSSNRIAAFFVEPKVRMHMEWELWEHRHPSTHS